MDQLSVNQINNAITSPAKEGYRVLGIGLAQFTRAVLPAQQREFAFRFKGIVAFYEPPKPNILEGLNDFYDAGIAVKIITGDNAPTTVLITANIFLTPVNRSFYYSILTTLKYKNKPVTWITGITVYLVALLLYIPPVTRFFGFEQLNAVQWTVAVCAGFIPVIWFEVVKFLKRTCNRDRH